MLLQNLCVTLPRNTFKMFGFFAVLADPYSHFAVADAERIGAHACEITIDRGF